MNPAAPALASAPAPSPTRSARRAILGAGLSCGVLDLTAACVQNSLLSGVGPFRLLQGVASALLGRAAFAGGIGTAALGLALHFAVAFTMAAAFYALSRRHPVLRHRALLVGPLYGLAVFAFMNYGALPFLSWFRSLYLHTPVSWVGPMTWIQAVIHMCCVGLPIALAVRRWSP